jgi:dCTP diphosphatase
MSVDKEDAESLAISDLQQRLRVFAAERDWDQFHSPKNLAMAIAAESGELLELFQWLTQAQSSKLADDDLDRVTAELADIQLYVLRMADALNISIPEAVEEKLKENAFKYPVELSKGNATKYSRREH